MANASYKLPEEFLLKLSRLGNKTDEIVPKVLEAGGKVVEAKVKANLQSVIGSGIKTDSRSTGQLVGALGITKPRQDRNGDFNVKVGFDEPRSDGKKNAMIASVLEYGKHGQPPRPFMKPAKAASKAECIEAMKAAFEKEVESI